jgi:hypothetical protein
MVNELLQQEKGNFPDARKTLDQVLSLNPLFVPATRDLAILCFDRFPDDSRTADLAAKARDTFPDDPNLAYSQPVRSVGKPYTRESKPPGVHKPLSYWHLSLISGLAPSLKTQERRKLLRSCCGILRASWIYQTFLSAQVAYYKHFTTVRSDSTTGWHAGCECIVTVEQKSK